MAFSTFRGKTSENLSKRLILQMEARKALINLYRELQEGIEVISPAPGTTLPYLAFRDYVNNVRMVYLEEDKKLSREEGRTIYQAMTLTRNPAKTKSDNPKLLMKYVVKLNFTTYNPGGVLISATLRSGTGDFSLVNFVRLQNVTSEDDL